ncbi:S8 family serine peptidase [Flavilitoribacter nigricans]|uniref:Peptidase S8/S53 domain-containing protein n=1 Tax=Flavilitoribacter nigricans (strain ATCC 23147 / DSM 23189 / NBRC 102662 / NCIMB 1420 / SS-2) TaxID=1122177 RepID=A0A2D0N0H1_FLAN2|nr:S8 family serine peptidase [Flavilitoribacter nigricans]PHN01213.1 hypothetical protein CRP01_38380 [Flavilitoribacter nigricans DSM 23189 = NBRC 102662]
MKIEIRPLTSDPGQLKSVGLTKFLKDAEISIRSSLSQAGYPADLEKSLLSCLLLVYFLQGDRPACRQTFARLAHTDVKFGETTGRFYDLEINASDAADAVLDQLESILDDEQTMREFIRWQLLMKSMIAFKYDRIFQFSERSHWRLTPVRLYQLLDLIVDWQHRSHLRPVVLPALKKRIASMQRKDTLRQMQPIDLDRLGIPLQKVRAMVWDTGVDASCLSDINTEIGLYYDQCSRRTSEALLSTEPYPANIGLLNKGLKDLSLGLENETTRALLTYLDQADKVQIRDFAGYMNFYTNYAHGTQVASILKQGHPHLEIVPVRITFDHKMQFPDIYTRERIDNELLMYREVFDLIRSQRIRIVNMSWTYNREEIETSLINNGLTDKKERSRVCEELFQQLRTGLYQGIKNCPETLFLAGAGNSNNRLDDDHIIPCGIDLPNLLAVGALNREGKRTQFTSTGKRVAVYANGEQVACTAPGGVRMYCSGTSYAAPAVANLAAKLWSIQPELPLRVVKRLILDNANQTAEGILIINPQETLNKLLQPGAN